MMDVILGLAFCIFALANSATPTPATGFEENGVMTFDNSLAAVLLALRPPEA